MEAGAASRFDARDAESRETDAQPEIAHCEGASRPRERQRAAQTEQVEQPPRALKLEVELRPLRANVYA